jgi:UDP-N-acetylglucosamine 2-epimerase (non-hydrolysing)
MSKLCAFLVAGARPNFMKVAPLYRVLSERSWATPRLVHTGQHHDPELSGVFFEDLGLPQPHVNLSAGSGSHAAQTARVLERFERALIEYQPSLVIVVGDVNSTLACALATAKTVYPSGARPRLAHVEAGLRSFDRAMPEEVNRALTDILSDFLFTTEDSANANLQREGIPNDRIFFVGNVMIDSLLRQAKHAAELRKWEAFGLSSAGYAVLTLHRPSNVDDPTTFASLLETLSEAAHRLPIIFPVHPRTTARIKEFGFEPLLRSGQFRRVPPLGYLDFLSLVSHARLVLTDSGGIQEETTVLGIPCITLRESTERPVTLTLGTNTLAGTDRVKILTAIDHILDGSRPLVQRPPLWDGNAAERIAAVLDKAFGL